MTSRSPWKKAPPWSASAGPCSASGRPACDPDRPGRGGQTGSERATSGSSHALRCRREEQMATSFLKKSMAYLGLVDDYDDYDEYDSRPTPVGGRQRPADVEEELPAPAPAPGRIRVTTASSQGTPVSATPQVT